MHRASDPRTPEVRAPPRSTTQVAKDLKPIYTAIDADHAAPSARARSRRSGAQRFPVITQAWLNAWEYVTPFLAFPPEVRRVIYTTDESVKETAVASRPHTVV